MAGREHTPFEMRRARIAMGSAASVITVGLFVVPPMLNIGTLGSIVTAVMLVALAASLLFLAVLKAPESGIVFELETRARVRAVCREAGLVTRSSDGKVIYPRMVGLAGSPDAWTVRIEPHIGQTVAEWEKALPRFSLAFGSVGARVKDLRTGWLHLHVGYQRLDGKEVVVPPVEHVQEDGIDWRQRLARVLVGTAENGGGYCVPLIDGHVLVAGITGSGKGSLIWSLVLGLTPALRARTVRLWGFDPKRMELSMGRQFFGDRYAATQDELVALLERAAAEMEALAQAQAGKARKFTPCEATPLNVLVIDELGYLSALLDDRKLQQRAERALVQLLVLGRSVGFAVVGALQDPRKSTLDFRDLFPTRVAMRLPKPMVDLVLGQGMHNAGAYCDLIPLGTEGAGTAFVLEDGTDTPQCVRFTWCPDDVIKREAAALPTAPVRPQLPEAA